jgi:cytidylate kinase
MPEDRVSAINDAMEELLGLHPPAEDLVQQTTETVLKLAEMGHVILVGRGANVITAHMNHVVHVRLVGSLERRIARVQEYHQMDRRAALAFIQTEDAGRARYLKKYFGKQIDDPLLYDLTLNTDHLTNREAAEMIAVAVVEPPPED